MSHVIVGIAVYVLGMCLTAYVGGRLDMFDVPGSIIGPLVWPLVLPTVLAIVCYRAGQRQHTHVRRQQAAVEAEREDVQRFLEEP